MKTYLASEKEIEIFRAHEERGLEKTDTHWTD